MALIRVSGTANIQPFIKTASTALIGNSGVVTSSGQLVASQAGDKVCLGIALETIASTDGDYATARPVLVDMLGPTDVVQCTVTGTLTAAMVGSYFDFSDSVTLDAGDITAPASVPGDLWLCVGFISATLGLFMLAGGANMAPAV